MTRVIVTKRVVQGYMHGQGIEKFADKSEFTGCVIMRRCVLPQLGA